MSLLDPPDSALHWSTNKGSLAVWMLSTDVIVQTLKGHCTLELSTGMYEGVRQLVGRGGRFHVFDNYDEATGYDTEVRHHIIQFSRVLRPSIKSLHILFRSKLLAMGVSLFDAAVGGGVKSYSNRTKFELQLLDAVAAGGPGTHRDAEPRELR